MKKILSLFCLFIAIVVAGCSCSKSFTMDDNLYNNESETVFIDLATYEEYQALLDEKKSFAIYIYDPACAGCIAFSPILTEYLQDNNLKFYRITASVAKSKDSPVKEEFTGTPSVFLFNKGEYVTFLDVHSSKKLHINAFASKEGFGEWFTKYVNLK